MKREGYKQGIPGEGSRRNGKAKEWGSIWRRLMVGSCRGARREMQLKRRL